MLGVVDQQCCVHLHEASGNDLSRNTYIVLQSLTPLMLVLPTGFYQLARISGYKGSSLSQFAVPNLTLFQMCPLRKKLFKMLPCAQISQLEKKKVSNNNILALWSAFIIINASVGGGLRREKPTSYLRLSRSHRVLLYPCCPLSDTLLHHPDQA